MKIIKIVMLISTLVAVNAFAEKIPDFSLPVFKQTEKFRLSENLKGKKVLINFWATWCTSCIHELPLLETLKSKYGESVTFIAINAGEQSNLMEKFFKKYKFSYIHLKDEDRSLSKSLKVDSLPVTIVLDKDMNVIYRDTVPPKEL